MNEAVARAQSADSAYQSRRNEAEERERQARQRGQALFSWAQQQWETRRADLPYPALPNPEHAFLVVVESKADGKIVASWMALSTTFLEGLHIAASHRQQPEIQGMLLGGMFSLLAAIGVAHPLTLAQNPAILTLAEKAGFIPIAGTLLKLE